MDRHFPHRGRGRFQEPGQCCSQTRSTLRPSTRQLPRAMRSSSTVLRCVYARPAPSYSQFDRRSNYRTNAEAIARCLAGAGTDCTQLIRQPGIPGDRRCGSPAREVVAASVVPLADSEVQHPSVLTHSVPTKSESLRQQTEVLPEARRQARLPLRSGIVLHRRLRLFRSDSPCVVPGSVICEFTISAPDHRLTVHASLRDARDRLRREETLDEESDDHVS